MGNPVKAVTTAFEHFTAPLTKGISRAFTIPGLGGQQQQADVTQAAPPTPAPPAQTPTGAIGTAGHLANTQLSFLTAASKAAAAIGQGATGGKSLLGA